MDISWLQVIIAFIIGVVLSGTAMGLFNSAKSKVGA